MLWFAPLLWIGVGDKLQRELRHATVRVGPTSGSELLNLTRQMFVIPENGPWRFLNAPGGM